MNHYNTVAPKTLQNISNSATDGYKFYVVICDIDATATLYDLDGNLRCGITEDGNQIIAVHGGLIRDDHGRAECARLLVLGRKGWWEDDRFSEHLMSIRDACEQERIPTEDGLLLVSGNKCRNLSMHEMLGLIPRLEHTFSGFNR